MYQGCRLRKVYRKRPCPRKGCKGRIGRLKERMIGWENYGIDATGHVDPLGPDGDHHAPVKAICGACGHEWTLRGVHSVEEVFDVDLTAAGIASSTAQALSDAARARFESLAAAHPWYRISDDDRRFMSRIYRAQLEALIPVRNEGSVPAICAKLRQYLTALGAPTP